MIREFLVRFLRQAVLKPIFHGRPAYWVWVVCSVVLVVDRRRGLRCGSRRRGLIATNMRDQVSWGVLHRELHVPGRCGRRRRPARDPRVRLSLEAHQGGRDPRRAARDLGDRSCAACSSWSTSGVRRASGTCCPFVGRPNLPELAPRMGHARPERVLPAQPDHRDLPALLALPRAGAAQGDLPPPGPPLDPGRHRDPHRDGLPLQRLRRADPSGTPPSSRPRFIASALCSGPAVLLVLMQLLRQVHALRDHERGDLEGGRADGLRHGGQPLPARGRGVQGVLLRHRAPGAHGADVPRAWAAAPRSSPSCGPRSSRRSRPSSCSSCPGRGATPSL